MAEAGSGVVATGGICMGLLEELGGKADRPRKEMSQPLEREKEGKDATKSGAASGCSGQCMGAKEPPRVFSEGTV